jgi:hypothetical protein
MQRGWIAGRYNITEKVHYCIVFVWQQFVNSAYAVTVEREREREREKDREVCTSFTAMQRIERNLSSTRKGDNQNETK